MSDQYILRDGQPVPCEDMREWGNWFGKIENRVLEQTELPGGVRVSTVFLGLDHSFGRGPAVLWETMVFGGSLDQEMDRYCSREAAEAGHREMVARATEAANA